MEIMSPKKKKTKKMTTTTTLLLYIPNDIIIDILSWVPAKSLLRFRWACKYWFHLITRDTSFTKLHLHCSTSTTTTTTIHHPHNLSVLISKQQLKLNPFTEYWYSYPGTTFQPCKIFQYYIDSSTTITTTTGSSFSGRATNPILSGIFVRFQILGSCHGLILFSYHLREEQETILCIWNPCTKEYKYLPKPPYGFAQYHALGVGASFGLGYDHSIEDYKVICNMKFLADKHVQVYTLGTNSWRYMGPMITTNIEGLFGNGVFVNGALHFIFNNEGANYYSGARRIVSFDFEKERYVGISNQPECLNDKAKSIQAGLTMFEGSLCLTMAGTGKTSIEAWVMKKDYNNMNNNQEYYSWSKLYEIIPHIYGIINCFIQPLRFTKDGKILLLDREENHGAESILLFDPKNNKITIHKVSQLHPIEQAATIDDDIHKIEEIYIESLVSLNSGTYIDEKGDYMHYWQENNYDSDIDR